MKLHINTCTMKFQSISRSLGKNGGSEDDEMLNQSLVEFTKFNHHIQKDSLSAYSSYIEKELHHLTTSEQLMVICMIHSKMQQEQWDCLRMMLNTDGVCMKHQS